MIKKNRKLLIILLLLGIIFYFFRRGQKVKAEMQSVNSGNTPHGDLVAEVNAEAGYEGQTQSMICCNNNTGQMVSLANPLATCDDYATMSYAVNGACGGGGNGHTTLQGGATITAVQTNKPS